MKRNVIHVMLIILAIFAIGLCMSSHSYAEGEGGNAETFDYTFSINFLNLDDTAWDFDNYDSLNQLILCPFLNGVEYTYTWSNGESGNGTTDSNGEINFKPSSTEKSSKVTITLKNLPATYDANGAIGFTALNKSTFSKITTDATISPYKTTYAMLFTEMIQVTKNEIPNINYYRIADPVKVNIKFLHQDGSEWTLQKNNYFPSDILYTINSQPMGAYGPDRKWEFNNGQTVEQSSILYGGNSYIDGETLSGSNSCTLSINGVVENDQLMIKKPEEKTFSKVVVNGKEVEKDNDKIIDIESGDIINIEYYIPKTVTGTFGMSSYDGSLSEDFVWNFHFDIVINSNQGNMDADDMYWTLEGDDTKHMAKGRGSDYAGDYCFDIRVPFGKKVTIHNLPNTAMLHNGESFKNIRISGDQEVLAYASEEIAGKTIITYKGENITNDIIEQYGLEEYPYHTINNNGNEENMLIDTSGWIEFFNWNDGFEVNHYVFRKNTQIIFGKDYEENIDIEEKDKPFHYRVKLTDNITKKPLTGKIAYSIYSNKDEIVDNSNEVKYAELNSEGVFDVYLKSGEYVKIGKLLTDEEIADKKLVFGASTRYETIKTATDEDIYRLYFNDLGMIPYGVEYSIEEIDDDYDYIVDAEGAEQGTGKSRYYYDLDNTVEQWYNQLKGFKFINNRKTGSLTIEKKVKGEETNKEFKFNIKITDGAENFPLEYEYENSNGIKGTIKFTAGDKVAKEDREFTEYTANILLKDGEKITIKGLPAGAEYEVAENEESVEGYVVEIEGATGNIRADDNEEKSVASFVNKEIVKEEPQQEEKIEEVKQVQTGDVVTIVITTLIAATAVCGATFVVKKRQ